MNRPNCFKCRYLRITWEYQRAYACAAHGFKGPRIPAILVQETSGMPCLLFTPKPRPVRGR